MLVQLSVKEIVSLAVVSDRRRFLVFAILLPLLGCVEYLSGLDERL